MLRSEFTKLRRSLVWFIVLGLPVVLVATGSANTLLRGEPLADGWHTLWLRTVVFGGMFPLPVSIGILASLVWRPEHRGGNHTALLTSPGPRRRLVIAKAAVVAVLAAAMQAVQLVAVVTAGTLLFRLEGALPGRYVLAAGMTALAGIPLAALQSALSMRLRSFAGPVALALVGAGVATVLLTARVQVSAVVLPHATLARATQLGTGTVADSGTITAGIVSMLVAGVAVMTPLIVTGATCVLDRGDAR